MDLIVSEEQLLIYARNGDAEKVLELLNVDIVNEAVRLDINCKGVNKANLGWTPLHLAAYFGNENVVQILLQHGADVNVTNNVGDTPLHKASHTGRLQVVMKLLEYDADLKLINAEGKTSDDLARTSEIRQIITAAQAVKDTKLKNTFLQAARDGDLAIIEQMLNSSDTINVNCVDEFGNTALHNGAYRNQMTVVIFLLQHGVDPSIKNKQGKHALELARTHRMRQLLDVKPMREVRKDVKRFEGPLLRKTRLLGWRPIWAVLERGCIEIFNKRTDATSSGKRKMFCFLDGANIVLNHVAEKSFSIILKNKKSLHFLVEIDELSEMKRQKWRNALKEHISYGSQFFHHGDVKISDDEEDDDILLSDNVTMEDSLRNANASQQILESKVNHFTESLNILTLDESINSTMNVTLLETREQLSEILLISHQMCNLLSHCVNLYRQQEEYKNRQLKNEMEKSRVLQEALHVLAEQHHELEQSMAHDHSSILRRNSIGDYSDPDEFYDCDEDEMNYNSCNAEMDDIFQESQVYQDYINGSPGEVNAVEEMSMWGSRCRLPKPMIPRNEFSIWSILKQCIGKELSKITMPVVFNEPVSFLQRVVEYMEYAKLLDCACNSDDPVERLEYVAAFAVSATASNWERVGKPFNPLLGETYELIREDLGFKIMAEQVSHHPPISAFHAESENYVFHGSVHPKLKFWGKSVEVTPKGTVTLELLKHNEVYTWQNVNCCVHNIIVGKLWIELYGNMEVTNHTTKHKAILDFKTSGWFGKDLHKVEGYLYDENKTKLRALCGKWVEALYSYDIKVWDDYLNNYESSVTDAIKSSDDVPDKGSTCNLRLENQKCLWYVHSRPKDTEQYYNFSLFAMMLNELKPQQLSLLPPTDARLRTDIRYLDEGKLDLAADEKSRLEEKQRAVRKERKKLKQEHNPIWFNQAINPYTGKDDWLSIGKYWERNWESIDEIFGSDS